MRRPFDGSFPITQHFGENPNLYSKFIVTLPDGTKIPLKGHNGMDFGLPTKTPVLAPHYGKITVGVDPSGYGNYIFLENDVEASVLAHLDSFIAKNGFQVNEGDLIALSDNTGNSTGPHLHWGYYKKPNDRANGYGGYENQEPFISGIQEIGMPVTTYSVGDIIEPKVELPVGPEPGKEDFKYGKIGPKFPAKVIGVSVFDEKAYYDIDQSSIGGGTGWIAAKTVDEAQPVVVPAPETPVVSEAAPAPVPPVAPENNSGDKKYSEAEYQAVMVDREKFWKERDEALEKLSVMTEQYNEMAGAFSGFKALGYEKPSDISDALVKKDAAFVGVTAQLQQALYKNKKLADMVSKKEEEDSTAIEEGMKAFREAGQLKKQLVEIAESTGTKPNASDVIQQFHKVADLARSAFKKAEVEVTGETPVGAEAVAPKVSSFDWLMRFLHLK